VPELPEVEVVRRGLVNWVLGRTITGVEVLDPRSVRRHALGPEDFAGNLEGAKVLDVVRRGKFLWMPLQGDGADPVGPSLLPQVALMAHLGMSGQLLMQDSDVPDEKHLKVRLHLSPRDGMPAQLRFVDQRIFGGLFVTSLVPTDDAGPGGLAEVPMPLVAQEASHIARDPLDPHFSFDDFYRRLRSRRTGPRGRRTSTAPRRRVVSRKTPPTVATGRGRPPRTRTAPRRPGSRSRATPTR